MVCWLSISFVIGVAVGSVGANTEVMERNSAYPCCKNPTIPYNQQCENTWTTNNKVIAHSKGSTKDCVRPCKEMKDGQMMLDECVAVTATTVCHDENNVVMEQKINFYSQLCSGSPGNHGSVGLLLLAMTICGLVMNRMIC